MKSAFFFDVDDTLCETAPVHSAAFVKTLQEFEVDVRSFDYGEFAGLRTEEVFRRLFGNNSEDKILLASKMKRFYYQSTLKHIAPMEGSIEILEYLAKNEKIIYAVSSGSSSSVNATLTSSQIAKYFQEVITCDSVSQTKPHPDPYLRAIQISNCAPRECLAIEDSETGVRSALAANLEVVLISPVLPKWALDYPIRRYVSLSKLLMALQERQTC